MAQRQNPQTFGYRGSGKREFEQPSGAVLVVRHKRGGDVRGGVLQVIGLRFLKFRLRGIEDDQFHAAAVSFALRRAIDSSKSIASISPRSYASPRRSASSIQDARISSSSSRLINRRSTSFARSACAS